jgi:hypothetical protein
MPLPCRGYDPGMTDDSRLDAIEDHIDKARKDAEDAGILEDPDEQRYYESGEEGRAEDDQTIVPPG